MTQESKADTVGYKHPPQEHQFRRGQSGNPSGRPKGSRNFKSELREELNELIRFRDGDREIEVSKQRALIKRLVASAIAGETLLGLCVRAFADADDDDAVEAPEDREIVEAFTKRKKRRSSTTADRAQARTGE
jgi:Family of unknown function (DUF5681)